MAKTLIDLEDVERIKNIKWCLNNVGYVRTTNVNKSDAYLLHRFLLNVENEEFVDHKNRNKLDNRKSNLRICTQQENLRNRNIMKNNKSNIIGVCFSNTYNKWAAAIRKDNKRTTIGFYKNKDDAVKARLQAELKYFGEFAPQQHLFEQYGIK